MLEIPLHGSSGFLTQVDDEDYARVSNIKWYGREHHRNWYVIANNYVSGKNKHLFLHRVILNLAPNDGVSVDHIDGNGLNNQKANLRICTVQQNNHNRKCEPHKEYKGVFFSKKAYRNPWMARICKDYEDTYLGVFSTAEEAAQAYNEGALENIMANSRVLILSLHLYLL